MIEDADQRNDAAAPADPSGTAERNGRTDVAGFKEPESGHHASEPTVRVGSLYEPAPAAEDAQDRFGEPGPALSRSSPFYKGLWGGLGALVALAIAFGVREISSVLVIFVVAAFLAIGLNPVVELLIRHGLRRGWAVLTVAIGAVAVITVIVVVVVSELQDQVTALVNDAPRLLNQLLSHESIRRLNDQYHFITNLQNRVTDPNLGSKLLSEVFDTGLGAVQAALSAVAVFVLTVYFLGALPKIKRALYSTAPASRRERVGQLGDEILRRTGRYVVGAVLVALLAGTVTVAFLFSVGLGEFAIPLALLVALLDLVPLVGSATGAACVVIIVFANSFHAGLVAAVFYVIYEGLEGYVIYPRVMRSSVDVPEYVTVMAVLVGGVLGGVVWALLALPIAAAGLLLTREVWVRRQDTR